MLANARLASCTTSCLATQNTQQLVVSRQKHKLPPVSERPFIIDVPNKAPLEIRQKQIPDRRPEPYMTARVSARKRRQWLKRSQVPTLKRFLDRAYGREQFRFMKTRKRRRWVYNDGEGFNATALQIKDAQNLFQKTYTKDYKRSLTRKTTAEGERDGEDQQEYLRDKLDEIFVERWDNQVATWRTEWPNKIAMHKRQRSHLTNEKYLAYKTRQEAFYKKRAEKKEKEKAQLDAAEVKAIKALQEAAKAEEEDQTVPEEAEKEKATDELPEIEAVAVEKKPEDEVQEPEKVEEEKKEEPKKAWYDFWS